MQSSSFISTRFCRISSFDAANQRHVWAIVFVWKQGEAGKLCQRGNRCITGSEKCPLMEWLVCIWICRNYPWAHKEQRLQLFLAIFRTSGPIWIGKKEVSPSVYTRPVWPCWRWAFLPTTWLSLMEKALPSHTPRQLLQINIPVCNLIYLDLSNRKCFLAPMHFFFQKIYSSLFSWKVSEINFYKNERRKKIKQKSSERHK